jgi:CBS domain containing-hemolysin-like protein
MTVLLTGMPLVLACVACQAFFSGSEMAVVSANRARLEALAEQNHAGAKRALALLAREEHLLGTTLIGTNLSVASGSTLTAWLMTRAGSTEELLATAVFLPLALVLGETLPKTIGEHHADRLAPMVAPVLALLQRAFAPALWLVGQWGKFLRSFVQAQPDAGQLSREDLVDLLDEKSQAIDPDHRRRIQGLFTLRQQVVEDCMTPLVEVEALPVEASLDEAAAKVLACGHSRLPLFEERVDNIVGYLDQRDLLQPPPEARTARDLMRDIRIEPETKRTDALLREMRSGGYRFVLVVDEYGGAVGVVTMEDLLEEIIGEIQDERDVVEPTIQEIGPREWRLPGRAEMAEVEDVVGRPLPEGHYDTVAGLLMAHLGHIPKVNEECRIGGFLLVVEKATDRTVVQVRLRDLNEGPA